MGSDKSRSSHLNSTHEKRFPLLGEPPCLCLVARINRDTKCFYYNYYIWRCGLADWATFIWYIHLEACIYAHAVMLTSGRLCAQLLIILCSTSHQTAWSLRASSVDSSLHARTVVVSWISNIWLSYCTLDQLVSSKQFGERSFSDRGSSQQTVRNCSRSTSSPVVCIALAPPFCGRRVPSRALFRS
jgi:hypothetical protein